MAFVSTAAEAVTATCTCDNTGTITATACAASATPSGLSAYHSSSKLWDRVNMDEDHILKTPDGKRRLTAAVWEPPLRRPLAS